MNLVEKMGVCWVKSVSGRRMGELEKNDLFEKFIEATFVCTTKLLGHEDRIDEQEGGHVLFTVPKLLVKMRKDCFH